MSLSTRLAIAFAVLLVGSPGLAQQASSYVTDELKINLRSGAGTGYRIKERISSGTALTVLAEQGSWSRVRTQGGVTGWAPSQYIDAEPPASAELPELKSAIEDARKRILVLETRLQRVRAERDKAHVRLNDLETERDELASKLDQARRGLDLAQENQRLKKEAIDLKRRIQELENQVAQLSGQNRHAWFLVGAGVLGFGLVLGLLAGRSGGGRRGNSNQL